MMGAPGQIPAYLPESIKEMIERIGAPATETIVQQYSGIILTVPVKVTESHWLYNNISQQAFTDLVYHYKREKLWIPRCTAALRKMKEDQIVQAKNNGSMTTNALARQHQMTDRGIRKLLARVRDEEPSPQTDLFTQE